MVTDRARSSIGQRFVGQIAVVTGAARGIGEGIARRLGLGGATLALLDHDWTRLESTVASFCAEGLKARGYQVDVAEETAVRESFRLLERDLGRPHVVVNSAGIVGPTNTPIVDYPASEYDRVYQVNLRGSFLITKYSLPPMLKQNYGRILLIASIAGKEGNPNMIGYSSTKAGVIGLVKGVAKEYAQTGITINGLSPAVIMTDLVQGCAPEQVAYMTAKIPMNRCGTIEEAASLSAWIVCRECSFTTGFVFDLSGGRATY